jgi:transcriptional regulator with XRE-family HTH domain
MKSLRELRKQSNLTQEQLALAADVSTSTVYHIEAGKVRPRPSIVRRLARALNVDPQAIECSYRSPIVETSHIAERRL